ncbi:MAG: hypothetical protein JO222_12740 [Frankiales bacterium]|nr:hypothetical protein [Frankiales bacterium]
MKLRTPLRPLAVAAAVLTAVVVVPGAGAGTRHSDIGSASVYGLDKNFTLVGYTSLSRRGMNSPIAVAGRCVYVGDRYISSSSARAHGGIAIVDAANPARPHQVGAIPPVAESSQREMRADAGLGILVVESLSAIGQPVTPGQPSINNLKIYDIHSNCLKPRLLATVDFGDRAPHEFFLWKDPKHPGRALAYVTFTLLSPDLMVYDLADPAKPSLIGLYDLGIDQAHKTIDVADESGSGYLHSLSVSDDGTRAYMATWDYGYYELDTSMLANPPTPLGLGVAHPVGIGHFDDGHNVHTAVRFAGNRPYVFTTQEDYAQAGHGCPFGWVRVAKQTGDGGATEVGHFMLPENEKQNCGKKNGTFSSHNPTLFPDVALLTWYSGGLRAVDISDPAHLYQDGAFVPRPQFTPALRDNRLFFPSSTQPGILPTDSTYPGSTAKFWTGAMWSYPVVQNGLIYVADIDLGLYILRYTGPHAAEIDRAKFVEGNSAPSRYSAKDKEIVRPKAQWPAIARETAKGPLVERAPFAHRVSKYLVAHGFLCM